MRKILSFPSAFPLVLFGAVLLAYGIFIPWFGLYGDDWIYLWNFHLFGAGSFVDFVAIDRPFSFWIYLISTPIFGEHPWLYHVLLLVLRWLSALFIWWILRLIWPKHTRQVAWVALLFALFPGFRQQPIAVQYILHFGTLDFTLLSLAAMLWAIRDPKHFRLFMSLSMLGALFVFGMEYFTGLELLRPVLLWLVLKQHESDRRKRMRRFTFTWLPFIGITVAFFAWRVFIFKFPTYQPTLLTSLASAPLGTLVELIKRILLDFKTAVLDSWRQVIALPGENGSLLFYAALVSGALAFFGFALSRLENEPEGKKALWHEWGAAAILLGAFAMLTAGWPIWVADVPLELAFPWDRSMLPFMLGTSLILAGLVDLLFDLRFRTLVVAGLSALAVGSHYQNALVYRGEWQELRAYFWQLAWRAPGLKPGTLVISDQIPLWRYSDNDLAPIVNWIYAPELSDPHLPYYYYDLSTRVESPLPGLEENLPITQGYRNLYYTGSTSDILGVYYRPPGCLRVLSDADALYPGLPGTIVESLHLSHLGQILTEADPAAIPPSVLGPEPQHGWCYFFEKADLARQRGEWAEVAALYEEAMAGGFDAGDGSEYLIFMEAFAHIKNWEITEELSQKTAGDASMQPLLCATWERLDGLADWNETDRTALLKTQQAAGCKN